MMRYRTCSQTWLSIVLLLLCGVAVLFIDRLDLIKFETTTTRSITTSSKVGSNNQNVLHYSFGSTNATVGLVDYCVGHSYATLQRLVSYNRRTYADKWGYNVFSGNDKIFPLQSFVKPLAWLKAAYFYQLLVSIQDRDVQWFLWVDCDALVTRFDLSVYQILEDLDVEIQHHVVVAKDPHTEFNSGVMFVRNSQWSRDLWGRTLQKASNVSIREHKWWEQQALLELYRENQWDEAKHILVIPDRWKINAFQTFRRNEFNASSFVLHRVNCRQQPECSKLFESFFCITMPNGSYPEELVDCSNATDGFMRNSTA